MPFVQASGVGGKGRFGSLSGLFVTWRSLSIFGLLPACRQKTGTGTGTGDWDIVPQASSSLLQPQKIAVPGRGGCEIQSPTQNR